MPSRLHGRWRCSWVADANGAAMRLYVCSRHAVSGCLGSGTVVCGYLRLSLSAGVCFAQNRFGAGAVEWPFVKAEAL